MNTGERELWFHSVERFAAREIAPHLESIEHGVGVSGALLEGLRALGLLEIDLSNGGLRLLSQALEVLSRTSAAPAALILAHAMSRVLLMESSANNGSSEVRTRALSAALLAYPLYAEPAQPTGEVRVRELDGELSVDGRVELVVGAPVAELLILPITERAVLVLDRATPGVEVGEQVLTLGMHGCPVADVLLRRVRVSRSRALEVPFRRVARRLMGPAAAIAAGVLERSASTATSYALERYQAGATIVAHQQVRAMLAGLISDNLCCHEAAERLSSDDLPEHEAIAVFIEAKERAASATLDGVQLLGGYGYMEDYGQERCLRDARQAQCLLGRTDTQRQELVSAWLESRGEL